MSKSNQPEEVQVLRFFEESSIEKAEVLFNIISVKMQSRRVPQARNTDAPPKIRKARKSRQHPEASSSNEPDVVANNE